MGAGLSASFSSAGQAAGRTQKLADKSAPTITAVHRRELPGSPTVPSNGVATATQPVGTEDSWASLEPSSSA
ncbi:hypothetical protein SF06_20180 [Pseudomonas flexibilis]|nr:hypothetical protein SF06_20180 [Pseudomonas flexibilis]